MSTWEQYYDKVEKIGSGGNADVYLVRCKTNGDEYALKNLRNKTSEKKDRFADEVKIMSEDHVEGMLPIVKASSLQGRDFWYTLPRATPIDKHIKHEHLSLFNIINGFIQLSETLSKLHEKQISHRDIKPENIYFYENRFALGDFGLVNYPEMEQHHTTDSRWLGAIFTIAPEMRQNPKSADGCKADVYSLAKTLWIILSGEKGFDGVYDYLDEKISLRLITDKYRKEHLVEIEELLFKSTSNAPEQRPSILEFTTTLESWCETYNNHELSSISQWKFINKFLFPTFEPKSAIWESREDIVTILNFLSSLPVSNHMLLSDGGGLDFAKSELASEDGCICIYAMPFSIIHLVKPKALHFQGFQDDPSWNYFLLECDTLEKISETCNSDCEQLVEDYPGNYVSAQSAQYGVYDYDSGKQLPDGARVVYRYFEPRYLIVLKSAPYNAIAGTYDGRHGDCSPEHFAKYMQELYGFFKKHEEAGHSPENIAGADVISKNPFKKEISERTPPKNYPGKFIQANYIEWNFKSVFAKTSESNDVKIAYYFKFKPESFAFSDSFVILTDGTIAKIDRREKSSLDNTYYLYNRKQTVEFLRQCENFVKEKCIESGYEEPLGSFFSVGLKKLSNPSRIFAKAEIKDLMQAADDRLDNTLVIDENGHAQIIRRADSPILYPVRHESWNAGNVYVGKYSSLSTLDENYLGSLEGLLTWVKYNTNRSYFCDYVRRELSEEELIDNINRCIE